MTETNVQETVEESAVPEPVVIKAENPSPEEMAGIKEHIEVNYNFDVEVKEVMFNFKKSTDKETSIVTLREAVQLIAGRDRAEASGGINLETIREIAETGVDLISVGALTHSVKAVDISMLFAT